jgi:hypothetical protein
VDHPGTEIGNGGCTGKKLIRRAALVLSEFPGITLDALAAMDVREFNTWVAEARRTRALSQYRAMQAAQTPHMNDEDYRAIIDELKRDMYGPEDWAAEAAATTRDQAQNREHLWGLLSGGGETESTDREEEQDEWPSGDLGPEGQAESVLS